VGLPVTFVLLVAFDVFFYSKLLPPQGKRRVLTIYFFRMAFVFLLMWIPNAFVNYFFPRTPAYLKWIIIGWSHWQGLVAAATSLLKPDIWQAVRDFLLCSCCPESSSPRSSCFGTDGGGGGGGNDGALSSSLPDDRDDMFTLHRMRSSRWVIWRQEDYRISSDSHSSQTTPLPKNIHAGTLRLLLSPLRRSLQSISHVHSSCNITPTEQSHRSGSCSGTMNGDSNQLKLSSRSLQGDPASSQANSDGIPPPVDLPLAPTIAGQKKENGLIPKHVDFEAIPHESAVFDLSTHDDGTSK
jgi:hypothetical protein